jgi:hypothetical protein
MSSHRRRNKALNASRVGRTVASADHRKSNRDAKKEAARASEKVIARARSLTLDDFGGRSDAPGG